MGFLCNILNHRHAISQSRCEHDIDRCTNADLVKENAGALQSAAFSLSHNKTALGIHTGAQGTESLQMLINGAGAAKIAATGQCNICHTETAQQRTQHIIGSAAFARRLIRNTAVTQMR